jgi:photosystem II stability/assembly factor-like uncharacterized protein
MKIRLAKAERGYAPEESTMGEPVSASTAWHERQDVRLPAHTGPMEGSIIRGWPASLMVLLITAAAFYALILPRPMPAFAPTVLYPDKLLINGLAQNGKRLIAVGEQGHILMADNASGPWNSARVEPDRGSTFTQVAFIDGSIALAVGHDGLIVRSTDNGATWKEVAFDAEQSTPLFGVAGPFDGKVFAFGAFGTLLMSSDQGLTWQPIKSDAIGDHHIYALLRPADGSLLLFGERGLMARSTDAGQNWQTLPSIYQGSFFGALQLPSKTLLAYGMRGNVFRSTDYGQTWKKSEVPIVASLFGGMATPRGTAVLVGASNTVFQSDDDGIHFKLESGSGRRDFSTVLALPDGGWLIGGDDGIGIRHGSAVSVPSAGATQ